MKYQIIEREIYSEADLFHFGDRYEMGEIINEHLPGFSGIPLGDVIFESENIEEVKAKKIQLEINRLKSINGGIICFFDDDSLADYFFSSENFTKLKNLYENEFDLEITRRNHNQMEVEHDEFYIPLDASDEQLMRMQIFLQLYFFKIITES